jgi:hypothetical protein
MQFSTLHEAYYNTTPTEYTFPLKSVTESPGTPVTYPKSPTGPEGLKTEVPVEECKCKRCVQNANHQIKQDLTLLLLVLILIKLILN